jgi:5-methyltetrahydropteroyltriglutamate--homocysteine methyltransferase
MQRYRADQVGSLLRPPVLLQARADHTAGKLSADALRQREDEAILEALEMQCQVGIDVLSDGEFRRGSWLGGMAAAVDGFVQVSVMLEWQGPGGGSEPSTSHFVGAELRQVRRLTEHESLFLKRHAPKAYKVTMPSPAVFQLASFQKGVTDKVYPTRWDMLQAFIPIVRREIEALVAEGTAYVQLDDPFLTMYLDPTTRARLQQAGVDLNQELQNGLQAVNACLQGIERSHTTFGLHICRGNSKSRWYTTGSYDAIAEQFFSSLHVDRFLLEYDDERSGGFEPLRFIPRGKTAVLGLVTTKRPQLESQEGLRRAIDKAAQYLPLDDLALSPQCGFASVAAGNLLSLDEQRRKLELVVDTARKVWG